MDEGILRMAEAEFNLAKEAERLPFPRKLWVSRHARSSGTHTAAASDGGQRRPASDAPARRPTTPKKKPDAAPPAHSQQGKRKWDQDWSNGQGAQSSKWAKSRW